MLCTRWHGHVNRYGTTFMRLLAGYLIPFTPRSKRYRLLVRINLDIIMEFLKEPNNPHRRKSWTQLECQNQRSKAKLETIMENINEGINDTKLGLLIRYGSAEKKLCAIGSTLSINIMNN